MRDPRNESRAPGSEPELESTRQMLEQTAQSIVPDATFTERLELRLAESHSKAEAATMFSFRKVAPALLWVVAAAAMIFVVDWMIRSLVPQPSPATRNTAQPTQPTLQSPVLQPTPVPLGKTYDWRGTTLTVSAALPASPAEMDIYTGQQDAHATAEEAQALAQRFGIQGSLYQVQGELPGTTDYFVTDGKQSLRVRSAGYLEYQADIVKAYNYFANAQSANAEQVIDVFLESHGYTFPHQVQWSEFRGGYIVEPLGADGTPLRFEFYSGPMMLFTLAQDGSILSLRSNLINISGEAARRVGIISAEEALQRALDPNRTSGIIESMHSAPQQIRQWNRQYPLDQEMTYYGSLSSLKANDRGQPAFIRLDGFPVRGETYGLDQFSDPTYVAATGRFVEQNGALWFNLTSWKMAERQEASAVGTLRREKGNVIMATDDGRQLAFPDVPDDVPMPFENAFAVGTQLGDTFEWKFIDNRSLAGGGGGGGGGLGFQQLNLSGTPVPLPTQAPAPTAATGGQYTVQAGDTVSKIAAENGTDPQTLMQLNGMSDADMLMVGQTLTLPESISERIEGLRGMLTITINKQPDGSQIITYGFLPLTPGESGGYMRLEGDGLKKLQDYNSRPVDVWGTLRGPGGGMIGTLQVERFEIPFPDLGVEAVQGTQKVVQLDGGQPATLFITDDGQTYIQLLQDGTTGSSLIGNEGDEVLLEAVAVPGESLAGYPAIRVFGGMLAIDPKSGLHVTMPVTMDKPIVLEMPDIGRPTAPPSATIDSIELELFASDPRYAVDLPSTGPHYFQPVWRFAGHYSSGDEFEILIQAARDEFLLRELEPYTQGG